MVKETNVYQSNCIDHSYVERQPQEVRMTHEIYAPPQSSVSWPQLTFGTVTGICAGIFIKKGAKAVAWFLGGIFILLQVGFK